MVPEKQSTAKPDPVAALGAALSEAWEAICATTDVVADMPSLRELFAGADEGDAATVAEAVVVNMLTEVMGWVCRFSPWYTKPASAYGLVQVRNEATGAVRWGLSQEGLSQWRGILIELANALQGKSGLVQILLLVDELMDGEELEEEECATAACACCPPRLILVKRAILDEVEIRCDVCRARFNVVDTPF